MFRDFSCAFIAVLAAASIAAGDSAPSLVPSPTMGARPGPDWRMGQRKAPEVEGEFVRLPDTRELLTEEISFGTSDAAERVGYVEDFDPALLPDWPWQERPDGSVATVVEFESRDACGLRLRFEDFDRAKQIQLRFFDPTGATVMGPFERPRLDDDDGWWSPTIWGEHFGVELYSARPLAPGARAPRISKVAYLAMACTTTPGTALGCHNDVTCSPSWANDDADGVALIYYVSGSGCARCSGALLNRQPNDQSPLFLTANHCVSSASEAASLEVYWFYETAVCNGPAAATPANQPLNLGSERLKRYTGADMTLLGLYDPPVGGANFLGWNSGSWSNNETATGVHHPRGTFKRISFGETGGASNELFCDSNGLNCFNADVRNVNFDDGTTEPGSSGSPIFDENRQIRGTLSGGESGCPSPTVAEYYGRLDLAYDNLKYFMGDSWIASPVYVDGGVSGDSGNNGNSEKGTSAEPFNQVYEATFAVRSGDDVQIDPGNYDEQFKLYRPMTLKRNGASGVVRIGD